MSSRLSRQDLFGYLIALCSHELSDFARFCTTAAALLQDSREKLAITGNLNLPGTGTHTVPQADQSGE